MSLSYIGAQVEVAVIGAEIQSGIRSYWVPMSEEQSLSAGPTRPFISSHPGTTRSYTTPERLVSLCLILSVVQRCGFSPQRHFRPNRTQWDELANSHLLSNCRFSIDLMAKIGNNRRRENAHRVCYSIIQCRIGAQQSRHSFAALC